MATTTLKEKNTSKKNVNKKTSSTNVVKKNEIGNNSSTKIKKEKKFVKSAPQYAEYQNINFDAFVKMWLSSWKNTFNFNGRSSRIELWSFLIINTGLFLLIQVLSLYLLSPNFLRAANTAGYSLNTIDNIIIFAETLMYLSIFAPLLPLGSIMIRRMHDINKPAWNRYLEPACMGLSTSFVLLYALITIDNENYISACLLLLLCLIATIYGSGYYILKFAIPTLFYKGDETKNDFGKPLYNEPIYEEWALKLSCIYFLVLFTISVFGLALTLI